MEAIDIWRTANLLLDKHGEDAPFEASKRPQKVTTARDKVGEHVWSNIFAAIGALRQNRPVLDEPTH